MNKQDEEITKLVCWNKLTEAERGDLLFFIEASHTALLRELEEKIEGMKSREPDLTDPYYQPRGMFEDEQHQQLNMEITAIRQRNAALSDIIELLKSHETEQSN